MTEDQKVSQVDDTNTMIRQNLVDTAVNFLLNVDVINSPEKSKAAFLRNKGLSDAEIALAFDRAKPIAGSDVISHQNQSVAPPLPYPQKTYSFWSQLSRISSSLIVVAVALYGLHHFYKLYIEPWLFGKRSEESQLRLMEQQLLELNTSISLLSTTVSTLEKSINSHKQQIDTMIEASGIASASVAVSSLKTEIGNVKSLLINRHQFPALPKVASPSIPHWQLQSTENDSSENGQDGDSEKDLSMKTECDQLTGSPSFDLVPNSDSGNGIVGASSSPELLSNHKNESQGSSFSSDPVPNNDSSDNGIENGIVGTSSVSELSNHETELQESVTEKA